MIRLIATDLDGTLVTDANTIHPENLDALREAMARGVRFAVASGRNAAACSILLRESGLDDAFIIGANGCELMERPCGRMLERHHMPLDDAAEALRIGRAHGLLICLFTDDAMVFDSEKMYAKETGFQQRASFAEELRALGVEIRVGPRAMDDAIATTPMKLYCAYQDGQEAAFAAARAASAALPGLVLTSSWVNNYEIMPAGVNKGAALKTLAERLGIGREEVMAFGDNDNDLEMLRWAGYGFAMGNAQEAVLREIERVTGHCHDGGVAMAIRAHVL